MCRSHWAYTEFWPLVNSRSHQSDIVNPRFIEEYSSLLVLIAYRSSSRDSICIVDKMMLLHYLLAQGRLSHAKSIFSEIDSKEAEGNCKMAYDYLDCYFAVFDGSKELLANEMIKCLAWKAKPYVMQCTRNSFTLFSCVWCWQMVSLSCQ